MNAPDVKQVLNERYQLCFILSLLAQALLVALHTVFLGFLSVPASQSFMTLASLRFLLNQCILGFTLAGIIYIHFLDIAVEKVTLVSHQKTLKYWLSGRQLFRLFALCGSGIIYATFLGGELSLTTCLNDHELFCILNSATLGISFHTSYVSKHLYCLKFESLQQLKVPKLKSQIRPTLAKSFIQVVKHLIQFALMFIIFRIVLHLLFPLEQILCNGNSSTFTIMHQLFGWNMLANLSLSYTFITSLSAMQLICQTLLTEEHCFPIANLSLAMEDVTNSLICYLAHLDFRMLAMTSAKRRKELFSISAPGGHPHTWNAVSTAALTTIRQFIEQLNPQQEEKPTEPKISPNDSRNINRSINFRSLISPTNKNHLNVGAPIIPPSTQLVKASLMPYMDSLMALLLPTTFIKYLKNEPADLKLEEACCKSQKVIWAVEGLSGSLVASYLEDHHGVVQWSLSSTIAVLLDLYMALERLHNRKCRNGIQQTEQGLKAATSSSLYRIVSKFHPHLKGSDFSEEHWLRIIRFKDFCE